MIGRPGRPVPPWVAALASLALVAGLALLLYRMNATPRHDAAKRPPLVLYSAAGLVKPVQDVVAAYQKEYGVAVQVEPGPSGKLLSQLRVAPGRAHLFLAADAWYVDEARRAGLVAEMIPLARQQPVLVVAAGNPKNIRSLDDLTRADVKVALANPELASIGRTVKDLFTRAGRWEAIAARAEGGQTGVSFVGTVNEVAQAVKLGAADAGTIWDALVPQFGLQVVPVDVFARPQEITIGVVTQHDRGGDALHFARYLTAIDRGLTHFAAHKFKVVDDADRWADRPEIHLMAGAMLKPGIEEAVTAFEARERVTVRRVYNGCGILVAQMKTGNVPDAYFSCDVTFMRTVQERFEPAVNVSRNPMVLLVPRGNPKGVKTLADLARSGLKIGLAHPQNSALGALTEQMLVRLGLREQVYAPGHTVIHADAGHMLVNQMRTGALDASVVYRSNATSAPDDGKLEIVALDLPDATATQPFAVSKQTGKRYLVRRLFDALARERERFAALGFEWVLEGTPR